MIICLFYERRLYSANLPLCLEQGVLKPWSAEAHAPSGPQMAAVFAVMIGPQPTATKAKISVKKEKKKKKVAPRYTLKAQPKI